MTPFLRHWHCSVSASVKHFNVWLELFFSHTHSQRSNCVSMWDNLRIRKFPPHGSIWIRTNYTEYMILFLNLWIMLTSYLWIMQTSVINSWIDKYEKAAFNLISFIKFQVTVFQHLCGITSSKQSVWALFESRIMTANSISILVFPTFIPTFCNWALYN